MDEGEFYFRVAARPFLVAYDPKADPRCCSFTQAFDTYTDIDTNLMIQARSKAAAKEQSKREEAVETARGHATNANASEVADANNATWAIDREGLEVLAIPADHAAEETEHAASEEPAKEEAVQAAQLMNQLQSLGHSVRTTMSFEVRAVRCEDTVVLAAEDNSSTVKKVHLIRHGQGHHNVAQAVWRGSGKEGE